MTESMTETNVNWRDLAVGTRFKWYGTGPHRRTETGAFREPFDSMPDGSHRDAEFLDGFYGPIVILSDAEVES